jgi:polyisoprenyl-phosphate glycosyltransferase
MSQLLLLIPIYDDWEAAQLLLARLGDVFAREPIAPDVMLVDDGSTMPIPDALRQRRFASLGRIDVLSLRRNMGHQRAIAIALSFVQARVSPDAVVVMDGDGEDAPEDVPRLVARMRESGDRAIVFAERTRRSESLLFRLFYSLYCTTHRLLTGIPVRVGNFSAIPRSQLERLVVVSELWNHYAAAVFKARIPRDTIPTTRARRLTGRSHVTFVGLIAHGLSALSVHAEVIGVRLLVVVALAAVAITSLLAGVIMVRLLTAWAIPGWATTASGILLVVLFQAIGFAILFAFVILHGRSQPSFIPVRDYAYFVSGVAPLDP